MDNNTENAEATQDEATEVTQDVTNEEQDSNTDAPQDGATTDDKTAAELKRARDEAAKYRTKLRDMEAKQAEKEKAEAEKRGEFERLYNEQKQTVKDLEKEIKELRTFKDEADNKAEESRQALLKQLPKDLQETFADATAKQIQTVIDREAAKGNSPEPNRKKPNGKNGATKPTKVNPGESGWLQNILSNNN